jgi:hypothetical protein
MKASQPESQKLPKRPYQPPQLKVYGDITEISKSVVFGMGNADNILGITKTH